MNKILFTLIIFFGCAQAANTENITESKQNFDASSKVDSTSLLATNLSDTDFVQWKLDFIKKAEQIGIKSETIDLFNKQVNIYNQAITSDQNQAEVTKFLWEYINSAVSHKRIIVGKQKYWEHSDLLEKIQSHFAIPKNIVLAIWGMETSYGNNLGSVPLVDSMATLSFEGRRKQFFETQLLSFLELYDKGDLARFDLKGSWAGGMGHTQFIPSTYKQFGVDFNDDGRRNLFDVADALASTANYLNKMGYNDSEPWGGEAVIISQNFDYMIGNDNEYRDLLEWQKLGVRLLNVPNKMRYNATAKLFVPAGALGPKFLLFKNFDVIKKYNNSDSYALAVGLLSNEIIKSNGLPMLTVSWPNDAKKLKKEDIINLQRSLAVKGFDVGNIDGIWGANSRRAIQFYQKQRNYVADGLLTNKLFDEIVVQ